MIDLYGPVLAKALFPAFEAARGRPTVSLLRQLQGTERWTPGALRDLQVGLLRRLLRHAQRHTEYYRKVFDERGLTLEGFHTVEDLARLPLLDRATLRATMDTRVASAPPQIVVTKMTSGSSGQPVIVKYNAESRHYRDATRWRGYGWAGYRVGMRAVHYWGFGPPVGPWWKRKKTQLDRMIKRDLYLDCTPRDDPSLLAVVDQIRRFAPQVIVAFANGVGALAQLINERGLRDWDAIPVLTGAERLMPHDRAAIERAFGPAFDTYGCREVQLIGAECEAHDGMHTSMESIIVELIVSEPDGTLRHAQPGESGQVVVTDLHNLAHPLIRYVTGDLAVARADTPCACGRGLARIGPIEGRMSEVLTDGQGRPVSGLVFAIILAAMGDATRAWQVVQRLDRSLVFKVIPYTGTALPERAETMLRDYVARYVPGVPFTIEIVDDLPLTAAGKRQQILIERPA